MRGIPVSGEEEKLLVSGREMAGCGSTVWIPLRSEEADRAEDDKVAARLMTSAEAIEVYVWVMWPYIADFLRF